MAKDPKESLDHFGRFIAENLRDKAMEHYDYLSVGHWKTPGLKNLQDRLAEFTAEQKQVIRRCVLDTIDSAIHDFLFKLQEQADFENRIEVLVDGNNVVEHSDGIHGEMFSEDGWFDRFSKDGEPPDEA